MEPELDALLADLAGSLVRTQELLNERFEGDLQARAALAAVAPEPALEFVKTCLPNLQMVRSMTVEATGGFSKTKSTDFKLTFRPRSAIYYVLHETTVSRQSRVRLTVEQTAILQQEKTKG